EALHGPGTRAALQHAGGIPRLHAQRGGEVAESRAACGRSGETLRRCSPAGRSRAFRAIPDLSSEDTAAPVPGRRRPEARYTISADTAADHGDMTSAMPWFSPRAQSRSTPLGQANWVG